MTVRAMTTLVSRGPLMGITHKVCQETETEEGIYGQSDRKIDNLLH